MKIYGIISEFNPFHSGHARIVANARERGADAVVAIMSGNAVQRGELAVLDKYSRAEAAVRSGVDLVLELPFPWSAASAEYFARAGVAIASKLCTDLIFGSECGNIDVLKKAAAIAGSADFREEYRIRTESGERAAGCYFSMLNERGCPEFSSNDILGIEYIRAACDFGANLEMHTLKREGADYNDTELGSAQYPSATAIRKAWQEFGFEDSAKYIPPEAYKVYERAYFEGEMCDTYQLSRAILTYFRLRSPSDFSDCAENEGGITNRICTLAHECSSLDELEEKLSTKRYTDAKLRRALLFAMTEVRRELLGNLPEYTTLLAANSKGRELLAANRRSGEITVVTKPADMPAESAQTFVAHRLDAIFTLAQMQPNPSGEYMKRGAYIQ